jgi:prolyl-tRNA synthetase
MKDAYSFDRDRPPAQLRGMFAAYKRIFDRFGLQYRAVAADTGAIGGDPRTSSRSSPTPAKTPSSTAPPATTPPTSSWPRPWRCSPARARPARPWPRRPRRARAPARRGRRCWACRCSRPSSPGAGHRRDRGRATSSRATVWLLLVRGDHDLNEIKAGKLPGLKAGFRFATVAEIEDHFGCKPGYLGPIGLKKPVKVIADRTVAAMSDFVCGANEADFHFTGVNWGRDLPEPDLVADIRNVRRRRPVARRQGRAGHPARHRGRPCVLPGHQVQPGDERHLPRRGRQAAALRWAATASASRASWARPSSRTTTSAASSGRLPSRRSPW